MRKVIMFVVSLAAIGALSATANAAPDFGPGNSQKGPQDAGAICHPPGQTAEFPAC